MRAVEGTSRPRGAWACLPLAAALVLAPFQFPPLRPTPAMLALPLVTALALLSSAAAGGRPWRPVSGFTRALVALALVAWCSLAWSVAPQRTWQAAAVQATAAAAAGAVAQAATPAEARLLAGAALLGGALTAAAGTYELLTTVPPFPASPPGGPFLYKNALAACLLATALLGLAAAGAARGGPRAAALGVAGWAQGLLPFTLSRGALYLAPLAYAALYLLTPSARRPRLRVDLLLGAALAVVVAGCLWAGVQRGAPPGAVAPPPDLAAAAARLHPEAGALSVRGRLLLWRSALQMLADRPLTGFGAGTFGEVFPAYPGDGSQFARDAHSEPLQVAAELGLPGLAAWTGAVVVGLGTLAAAARADSPTTDAPWRAGAGAAAAVWLLHGAIDIDLRFPGIALSFWSLLAAGLALARRAVPAAVLPPAARRRALAGVVGAGALLALAATLPFAGDALYRQALVARSAGLTAKADALLGRAALLAPFDPRPRYVQAADRLERALRSGDAAEVDRALAALAALARRHPHDDELQARVGLAYARAGRLAEAEAHLRRAVEAFPYNPFHRYELASLLIRRGDLEEARTHLQAVVARPGAFLMPFRPEDGAGEAITRCRQLLRALIQSSGRGR